MRLIARNFLFNPHSQPPRRGKHGAYNARINPDASWDPAKLMIPLWMPSLLLRPTAVLYHAVYSVSYVHLFLDYHQSHIDNWSNSDLDFNLILIKYFERKVMQAESYYINTKCNSLFYRLDFEDVDVDREIIAGVVEPERELVWWEEVDRVFPLDYNNDMSEANSQDQAEENAAEQSVRLERGEPTESDSVFADAEEDSNVNVDESKNAQKKKRRRSSSAKNASKRTKGNAPSQKAQASARGRAQQPRGHPRFLHTQAGRGRAGQSGQDQTSARDNRSQQRDAAREFSDRRQSLSDQRYPRDSQGNLLVAATAKDLPRAARAQLRRPHSPRLTPGTPSGRSQVPGPPGTSMSGEGNPGVTPQGLDREAHRQLLEANNPVEPAKTPKQKDRVPPERTFEITDRNMMPVNDDYVIAASLLSRARKEEDAKRRSTRTERLKLDSRLLRTGDWIVMAKNENTKDWLHSLFRSDVFKDFVATLVSDQANLKYAVKVHPPDSREYTSEQVLEHMFQDFDNVGYVRIINESRSYKDRDGEVNKAYHKALKKRLDFDDGGTPYVKTIWIRMSEEAQRNILENPDLLDLGIGATELEFEKVKDKKKKAPPPKRPQARNKDKSKEPNPPQRRNRLRL